MLLCKSTKLFFDTVCLAYNDRICVYVKVFTMWGRLQFTDMLTASIIKYVFKFTCIVPRSKSHFKTHWGKIATVKCFSALPCENRLNYNYQIMFKCIISQFEIIPDVLN